MSQSYATKRDNLERGVILLKTVINYYATCYKRTSGAIKKIGEIFFFFSFWVKDENTIEVETLTSYRLIICSCLAKWHKPKKKMLGEVILVETNHFIIPNTAGSLLHFTWLFLWILNKQLINVLITFQPLFFYACNSILALLKLIWNPRKIPIKQQ